ncbi:hypothetical protein R3P38DRAFT_2810025 [Favolaschia claudopus]|uniref:Uncharacterized protein n=1 Tax=Favolaschia claudopus TaxID=2862362 RepID=A0AAV9ZBU4_9AGAR
MIIPSRPRPCPAPTPVSSLVRIRGIENWEEGRAEQVIKVEVGDAMKLERESRGTYIHDAILGRPSIRRGGVFGLTLHIHIHIDLRTRSHPVHATPPPDHRPRALAPVSDGEAGAHNDDIGVRAARTPPVIPSLTRTHPTRRILGGSALRLRASSSPTTQPSKTAARSAKRGARSTTAQRAAEAEAQQGGEGAKQRAGVDLPSLRLRLRANVWAQEGGKEGREERALSSQEKKTRRDMKGDVREAGVGWEWAGLLPTRRRAAVEVRRRLPPSLPPLPPHPGLHPPRLPPTESFADREFQDPASTSVEIRAAKEGVHSSRLCRFSDSVLPAHPAPILLRRLLRLHPRPFERRVKAAAAHECALEEPSDFVEGDGVEDGEATHARELRGSTTVELTVLHGRSATQTRPPSLPPPLQLRQDAYAPGAAAQHHGGLSQAEAQRDGTGETAEVWVGSNEDGKGGRKEGVREETRREGVDEGVVDGDGVEGSREMWGGDGGVKGEAMSDAEEDGDVDDEVEMSMSRLSLQIEKA